MSKKNKNEPATAPKPPSASGTKVKPTGKAAFVAQLQRVQKRIGNLCRRLRNSEAEQEMLETLKEVAAQLEPVATAASELPADWKPRSQNAGNNGINKSSWAPGTAVQIGEKHRERYNGLLDVKEMNKLTVKVIVAKTAKCTTKDGDTVIIPIMHLQAIEDAA